MMYSDIPLLQHLARALQQQSAHTSAHQQVAQDCQELYLLSCMSELFLEPFLEPFLFLHC